MGFLDNLARAKRIVNEESNQDETLEALTNKLYFTPVLNNKKIIEYTYGPKRDLALKVAGHAALFYVYAPIKTIKNLQSHVLCTYGFEMDMEAINPETGCYQNYPSVSQQNVMKWFQIRWVSKLGTLMIRKIGVEPEPWHLHEDDSELATANSIIWFWTGVSTMFGAAGFLIWKKQIMGLWTSLLNVIEWIFT